MVCTRGVVACAEVLTQVRILRRGINRFGNRFTDQTIHDSPNGLTYGRSRRADRRSDRGSACHCCRLVLA